MALRTPLSKRGSVQIEKDSGLLNCILSWLSTALIIVLAVITSVYDGDCGNTRLWLEVLLWSYIASVAVSSFAKLLMCCTAGGRGMIPAAYFAIMQKLIFFLFWLVWWIVGNVWYFDEEDCDDFEAGHILMLVIIICYYLTWFSVCCGLTIWGCVIYSNYKKMNPGQKPEAKSVAKQMEEIQMQVENIIEEAKLKESAQAKTDEGPKTEEGAKTEEGREKANLKDEADANQD